MTDQERCPLCGGEAIQVRLHDHHYQMQCFTSQCGLPKHLWPAVRAKNDDEIERLAERCDQLETESRGLRQLLDAGGQENAKLKEQVELLEVAIEHLRDSYHDQIDLLHEFKSFNGDEDLWVILKRQRDKAREENAKLKDELQDWKDSAATAAGEMCGDEKHCTCVPLLRKKIAELERLRAFDTGSESLPPGVMLEFHRLDGMWQKLVKERDSLKAELAAERRVRCRDLDHAHLWNL